MIESTEKLTWIGILCGRSPQAWGGGTAYGVWREAFRFPRRRRARGESRVQGARRAAERTLDAALPARDRNAEEGETTMPGDAGFDRAGARAYASDFAPRGTRFGTRTAAA
jgi:hypothetical protein